MRAKKITFYLLAFCMAVVSAGCWDSLDINDKALITLVITDRQNDEFIFYVEVPNLSAGQSEEGGREQYEIVTGSGTSYAEARRHLNAKMDKPIFLGTVRALVLTDELTKHGVEEYFFRMQNMLDYRKTLNVVTTSERPEDFLLSSPENNISIGYSIEETVSSLKSNGKVVIYTVSDVLEFLYADYYFVLLNMDLREGTLAYTGYSIIHNGKYNGFIPLEESNGLVWLLGDNIEQMYVVVPMEDIVVTIEVTIKKREIRPVYTDGQIMFDIRFVFDSKVQYINRNVKIDEKIQEQVKSQLQTMLVEDIAAAINHSRSLHCDYLQFKEHFRLAYPNVVKKLDWDAEYMNATFNISVQTTLDPGGTLDLEAQGESMP